MKINYVLLSSILVISSSLTYGASKTLVKGVTDDGVNIEVERDLGKLGDGKYQYEIELTGVDPYICKTGTFERLATYELGNYVAKFKNPTEDGWCYFFPEGKTPSSDS